MAHLDLCILIYPLFLYSPNYFFGLLCNSVLLFYVPSQLTTNYNKRVNGNVISVVIKATVTCV